MIIQPESSVQFNDEQSNQLNVFENKLSNVQREVIIYSQQKATLQGECLKLQKELGYMMGQKTVIENDIITLNENKESLERECHQVSVEKRKYELELEELNKTIISEKQGFDSKKKDLEDNTNKYKKDRAELDTQLTKFAQDSTLLQKKHSILSEAIKAIGN